MTKCIFCIENGGLECYISEDCNETSEMFRDFKDSGYKVYLGQILLETGDDAGNY